MLPGNYNPFYPLINHRFEDFRIFQEYIYNMISLRYVIVAASLLITWNPLRIPHAKCFVF